MNKIFIFLGISFFSINLYSQNLPVLPNPGTDPFIKKLIFFQSGLESLSTGSRNSRWITGGVVLGSGLGLIIGGNAYTTNSKPRDPLVYNFFGPPPEVYAGAAVMGLGLGVMGISLIPFLWESQEEVLFSQFRVQPVNSPEHLMGKVVFAQKGLKKLSDEQKFFRYLRGVTCSVTSGFFLYQGLFHPSNDWEIKKVPLSYAAIAAAGALLNFLVPNPSENLWLDYEKL